MIRKYHAEIFPDSKKKITMNEIDEILLIYYVLYAILLVMIKIMNLKIRSPLLDLGFFIVI